MKIFSLAIVFASAIILSLESPPFGSEEELADFVRDAYEKSASKSCNKLAQVEWDYLTDIANMRKQQDVVNETLAAAEVGKYYWDKYFRDLNVSEYKSKRLVRQITKLQVLGDAALDLETLGRLTSIRNRMRNVYSSAKICPYKNQRCNLTLEGLSLEPEIESIMAKSTNYDELLYVWTAWRNATGHRLKHKFNTYVELSNEAAKVNGFSDMGEFWKSFYETPNFEEDMDRLWEEVRPLYGRLHTYVSMKLKQRYGKKLNIEDQMIPAHVFGNMWAQNWVNIMDLVRPFPNATSVDVTQALKKQGYDVQKMFRTANDFYTSLGLEDNSIAFNVSAGAITEKPEDREIMCHASAADFCDGKNYRIKMCTEVDYEDFITIHHEMGHIQYYLLYKDKPITFREGANPGFHEAVGDTIALSVSTPKHLEAIGILDNYSDSYEADINALMKIALERVAFLPFGLLLDKWRWDVFSGKIPPVDYNSHWWEYRELYQRIKAPTPRSDNIDFDPGAKYHVASDSQYINYFVAHILEFQLYRALCIASGEYVRENPKKPLHKCDFYRSLEAGNKLREGLSLGSSEHWKDVLEKMTGERELNASALLEYFKPLSLYLEQQNQKSEIDSVAHFREDFNRK